MTKLLGYQKGVSKKSGNPYCMIYVVSDFADNEKANGAQGSKVESMFMPTEQIDSLKPVDIGKEIILGYSISGGRAFLNNVTVK